MQPIDNFILCAIREYNVKNTLPHDRLPVPYGFIKLNTLQSLLPSSLSMSLKDLGRKCDTLQKKGLVQIPKYFGVPQDEWDIQLKDPMGTTKACRLDPHYATTENMIRQVVVNAPQGNSTYEDSKDFADRLHLDHDLVCCVFRDLYEEGLVEIVEAPRALLVQYPV